MPRRPSVALRSVSSRVNPSPKAKQRSRNHAVIRQRWLVRAWRVMGTGVREHFGSIVFLTVLLGSVILNVVLYSTR